MAYLKMIKKLSKDYLEKYGKIKPVETNNIIVNNINSINSPQQGFVTLI